MLLMISTTKSTNFKAECAVPITKFTFREWQNRTFKTLRRQCDLNLYLSKYFVSGLYSESVDALHFSFDDIF